MLAVLSWQREAAGNVHQFVDVDVCARARAVWAAQLGARIRCMRCWVFAGHALDRILIFLGLTESLTLLGRSGMGACGYEGQRVKFS